MIRHRKGAVAPKPAHAKSKRADGFTLAELLVTSGVLVLLVFLASQLFNSAATVTTLGHKQMDADSQARQILDRMSVDFAQMVKRPDVDYYIKSNPISATIPAQRTVLQPGNDQIAFYSAVPGYYPASSYQSPVSLVAYRVNSDSTSSSYNKVERMGKGLLWNAATPTPAPMVFIPIPLASPLPESDMPTMATPTPTATPSPAWPETAICTPTPCPWSDSEVIGSQVFRFEYYYLLRNGSFSDVPWISPTHSSVSGMQDVSAIVVDIAVIDPKSKVLLSGSQIAQVASQLIDWGDTTCTGCPTKQQWRITPGLLRTQWQNKIGTLTTLPGPALSGIRLYERFIYLSPPIQ